MLCLLTWADIGAVSPDTLTPWKEELLWRLYVDTYNRLTYGYADDLIAMDHAGLEVVVAGRPEDITEAELWAFLDGLPRRYLRSSGWRRFTATSGSPATSARTRCTRRSSSTRTSGSCRSSRSTSRSSSRTSPASCPTSAWTSTAPKR